MFTLALVFLIIFRIGGPLTLSAANNMGLEALAIFGVFRGISRKKFFVIPLVISIVVLIIFLNIYWGHNLRSILIEFKILWYTVLAYILTLSNRNYSKNLLSFIDNLLFLFFIYYIISVNNRPHIVLENNYEILPFLIYLLVLDVQKLSTHIKILMVFIISILSGSRSVLAADLFIMAFIYYRHLKVPKLLIGIAVLVLIYGLVSFGGFRKINIEELDRFIFLRSFWNVFSNQSYVVQLFGSLELRPLPASVCDGGLAFYDELIVGRGLCYSVLWHVGVIRNLYTFGVVGTVLLYRFLYKISKSVSKYNGQALFVVFMLSSMSVSGFASISFILALLILKNGEQDFLGLKGLRYN